MPRSFLVPLGARMPDSSVPPSEWAAAGTATQDYTLELNRASRELGPKGTGLRPRSFSDRERQLRAEFLEAARRAMDYAGEPLLRRTYTKADQSKASTPASIHP